MILNKRKDAYIRGLLIALDNLDAVISLIRGSRTPEDANGLIDDLNLPKYKHEQSRFEASEINRT